MSPLFKVRLPFKNESPFTSNLEVNDKSEYILSVLFVMLLLRITNGVVILNETSDIDNKEIEVVVLFDNKFTELLNDDAELEVFALNEVMDVAKEEAFSLNEVIELAKEDADVEVLASKEVIELTKEDVDVEVSVPKEVIELAKNDVDANRSIFIVAIDDVNDNIEVDVSLLIANIDSDKDDVDMPIEDTEDVKKEVGGGLHAVIFKGRRYDTGDKLSYLQSVVQLASEREDLGPAFKKWLKTFVNNLGN